MAQSPIPSGSKFKPEIFYGILLVLLPWVLLWPKFSNYSFSFLDDAFDLRFFRGMAENFSGWWQTSGFHGEIQNGRIRPFYWVSRFFLYYLPFGSVPFPQGAYLWHWMHYFVFVAILFATFYLVRKISGKSGTAFLACLLWLINSKTAETFIRLAPAEVWQLFWGIPIAIILYFLTRTQQKKTGIVLSAALVFFTFIFYFCKETSVVLLPLSLATLLFSLIRKQFKFYWAVFFGANLAFFCLQRACAPHVVGYASAYRPALDVMIPNLGRFLTRIQWPFLLFPLVLFFCARLANLIRIQKSIRGIENPLDLWAASFLFLGAGFMLIYLPWSTPSAIHLVIADYLLALFMALEISQVYGLLLRRFSAALPSAKLIQPVSFFAFTFRPLAIVSGAVILLLAFLSAGEFLLETQYAYGHAGKETPVQSLIFFSKMAKPNAKVVYFEAEREFVQAASTYLTDYLNRPDITLYSTSPFALQLNKEGFSKIIPLAQKNWPGILEQMDYIYWNHRGVMRGQFDLFHLMLMRQLLQSPESVGIQKVYDRLFFPLNGGFPEGTEIWQVDQTKIREARNLRVERPDLKPLPESTLKS